MNNRARKSLIMKLKAQAQIDLDSPPVVALEDFFKGNTDEYSIAPNQVDEGRPSLAEVHQRLREIAARPDVQAVLVGLHPDWAEALEDEEVWPAAENVHIYTTASLNEVELWLVGLTADGAVEGWPYGKHPSAAAPPPECNVFTVCWD